MKETIQAQWLNDLAFEVDVDGHKLYLDTALEHGGKNMGPRPKLLMMVALAGCTAMDVVSILNKMRIEVDEFSVAVEGELAEEHPKKYEAMKVIFRLKGNDIPLAQVEKAVNLSSTKYCGVSANYTKAFPVTYEIVIEEE